ncbi:MAG: hypothetical protein M1815_003706 [Lichina confinis]|nr:MAG: hypothetical protein M1815_003706 [Lichina confinis]
MALFGGGLFRPFFGSGIGPDERLESVENTPAGKGVVVVVVIEGDLLRGAEEPWSRTATEVR